MSFFQLKKLLKSFITKNIKRQKKLMFQHKEQKTFDNINIDDSIVNDVDKENERISYNIFENICSIY